MRFPGSIAALAIAAVLAGCSFPRPDIRSYQATIDRVEERPGDFYSPERGHEPLICIYLNVADPSRDGRTETVRVLVLDVYNPMIYGRVGDRVRFSFPGNLPRDGEVEFESLSGFRVVPRDASRMRVSPANRPRPSGGRRCP
jgi:hypothetical protein